MTDEEFRIAMRERGWSDEDIEDELTFHHDPKSITLPLEEISKEPLIKEGEQRTYYSNEKGYIADKED